MFSFPSRRTMAPGTNTKAGGAVVAVGALVLFPLEDAVLAICDAFADEPCALFKHEVAFVLGQLEHPASTAALCSVLRAEAEHPMVRHEAAEALGAIASDEALGLLREYAEHDVEILRESCWVALHMYDREAFLAAGVCV